MSDTPAAVALQEATLFLRRQDGAGAERLLRALLAREPRNAQALRLLGMALSAQQRYPEAVETLRAALALDPSDALANNSLGNALGRLGDKSGAAAAFGEACTLAPAQAALWYNFGKALSEDLRDEEALAALTRAIELAPDHLPARFLHARTLRVTGRGEEALAAYRAVLARHPHSGEAWLGLSNLKQVRFDAADVAAMEAAANAELSIDDQTSIRFALARGHEDLGQYEQAWRWYGEGNARVRQHHPWDAAQFSQRVSAFLDAFAPPPAGAPSTQGAAAIFIASMPRAGSSLVEQILASHPQVDGAGELPDLVQVLHEESQRRGVPYPAWARAASPGDWRRLGERYLERTARWRATRPRFTDKLPDNWRHVGAILAMLPAARVVLCVRDPVETALACFRQLFSGGSQAFSYSVDDIAAYARDFQRAVAHWQALYPERVRIQSYEELVAEPEREIRALLAFCDLPFYARCLDFHQTERSVRTASAGQVREPLRRDTARAPRYGALLDPLRHQLGLTSKS